MSPEEFLKISNVSRETFDDLTVYADLLRKWTPKINLVAKSTLDDLWARHFLDSIQMLDHIPQDAQTIVDLGSGGGFPGLVLAICLKSKPDATVHLVESDQRKCVFLQTVSRETSANVVVHNKRIEEVDGLNAGLVTARALASLDKLLSYARHHLQPDGAALFLKGAGVETELTEAQKNWTFEADLIPSQTHPDGRIVRVSGLDHVAST